jgi:putative peptide zinc metalloprotease protein
LAKSLYSPSWYRVADLKPRLRAHARLHRHHFRGQLWYVLQDRTSGRYHRFSPAAYLVVSLMDGQRSVQEIWDLACNRLGEDVVTQDEIIRLLAQLHSSNVLYGDVPPDLGEMADRGRKQKRRKLLMSFMNPLAIRIPIFDPDEFLTATLPVVRPLMSWFGVLLFVTVVGYALTLVGVHWSELTENIADRVLATESLLLLLLTYPLVKAVHELGHGYAVKRWGGEVHEIGIMFLVFMPVPYVDASEASGFHNKWRRVLVGGAGILVEVFLAALAMFVWVEAEEGLVRAFAFNVMLIGGVSTVLFNGNPLLRFDGYYVLSDLLEIPNLGNRSNRYIGYLIQRYLFGIEDLESPANARGEAGWFFFYSIASFVYRLFIVVAIVLFVASKFFVIGVLMAIWSVILMLGLPLAKQTWFLLTSPLLRRKRGRAMAVTAGVIGSLVATLLFLPVPYATLAEGVVWTADDAAVHARAEGTVAELLVPANAMVSPGDPLMRLEDDLLDARVRVLQSRSRELRMRYEASDLSDPVEARIVLEQLRHAQADLELALQNQKDLIVRSDSAGHFIMRQASDWPGRYVKKGEVLGYVLRTQEPIVRVVVAEDEADLVRKHTGRVELRFADRLAEVVPARIEREVPVLSDTLPSMALSTMGGGQILVDPSDPQHLKVLANLLHLELVADASLRVDAMGGRVYVRFDHGQEPLASRLYRSVRQVFLKQFNV